MFNVKMMPGQKMYTFEELKKVYKLIEDAAKENITEQDEIEGVV